MTDVPPQEQDLDALAASLRLDASDIGVFFQVLATRLNDAMPGIVTLAREGGLFKKDHPVKKITVRAGGDVLEAERCGAQRRAPGPGRLTSTAVQRSQRDCR